MKSAINRRSLLSVGLALALIAVDVVLVAHQPKDGGVNIGFGVIAAVLIVLLLFHGTKALRETRRRDERGQLVAAVALGAVAFFFLLPVIVRLLT